MSTTSTAFMRFRIVERVQLSRELTVLLGTAGHWFGMRAVSTIEARILHTSSNPSTSAATSETQALGE